MALQPIRLFPTRHAKVWGSTDLQPWFDAGGEKIGEYWFTADNNPTSTGKTLGELLDIHGPALLGTDVTSIGRFPILVKFLFTTENLSIQVHPDDSYGLEHENSPGKTEMWYILRSDPNARIALGFREECSLEAVRASIDSKEIVALLDWVPTHAGQSFFTPAGTVHALGGGLAVLEIQQNSDVTYRLYDYGRPRELHVEKSLAVAHLRPHPGPSAPKAIQDGSELARCPYFATELIHIQATVDYSADIERFHLLIFTKGSGTIDGEPFRLGDCFLIPATSNAFIIEPSEPVEMVRTFVPRSTDA